jgi:hypothetical protein
MMTMEIVKVRRRARKRIEGVHSTFKLRADRQFEITSLHTRIYLA